jgi:serine/threonine-protein kinase
MQEPGAQPRAEGPPTERYDALNPELLDGRYELGPVIGRGGTGVVRHGYDRLLGREVAIKSLHPYLVAEGETVERFLDEARLAARLQHPHAVAIHDVGVRAEPYIVMELLTGGTLADVLAMRTLSSAAVARLGRRILSALEAAHACGIIHRDIKPANIMFTRDGTVKVVDFGIATSVDRSNHTATGTVLGTLRYLAPERLGGSRATVASDLYSVGVVLHEAVIGAPPFVAETPAALLAEIAHAPAEPDVARPGVDVAPEVAATIARALRRDPAARFASAAEMAAALRPRAREIVPGAIATGTATSRPRRSAWASVGAAIGVGALALGIAGATRDGGAASAPRTSIEAEVVVTTAPTTTASTTTGPTTTLAPTTAAPVTVVALAPTASDDDPPPPGGNAGSDPDKGKGKGKPGPKGKGR